MEIALAFLGAGIGSSVRSMLTKRKYTLFLCVALLGGCGVPEVVCRVLEGRRTAL
ncbi:MAG: hypothetical protein ACLUNZ_12220 [Evtepia sp.]